MDGPCDQRLAHGPAPRRLVPIRDRLLEAGDAELRREVFLGRVQERAGLEPRVRRRDHPVRDCLPPARSCWTAGAGACPRTCRATAAPLIHAWSDCPPRAGIPGSRPPALPARRFPGPFFPKPLAFYALLADEETLRSWTWSSTRTGSRRSAMTSPDASWHEPKSCPAQPPASTVSASMIS